MSRPTEGGVDEAEGSRLTVLRYRTHLVFFPSLSHPFTLSLKSWRFIFLAKA